MGEAYHGDPGAAKPVAKTSLAAPGSPPSMTAMFALLALAALLPGFELARHEEHLVLPELHPDAQPSWFGMPITVRPHVDRRELVQFLEASNIETRLVFAGNVLRQPGFQGITHRVHGELRATDAIMERSFFIGVYPGLTEEMRAFVVSRFDEFFRSRSAARSAS